MSAYSGPAKWWTLYNPKGREHVAKKGILQTGLVFHLDAGVSTSYPGSGTIWTDLSSSGYNGTLTNGPTYDSTNGGSIVFNGTSHGVVISSTAALSVNAMTISSWNFSTNYNHNGFMFEKTTNNAVNTQYSLFFNSNSTIYYRTYGLSTVDLTYTWLNQNTLISNAWNNVVATFDGSYKKIYINGVLRATSGLLTGSVTQNTTGAAYVGVYGGVSGYFFSGKIAATRVYNVALTDEQIRKNFNALRSRFGV